MGGGGGKGEKGAYTTTNDDGGGEGKGAFTITNVCSALLFHNFRNASLAIMKSMSTFS